jgi:hypothetical protein
MRKIQILLISLLSISALSQNLSCVDFKTGDFELKTSYFQPTSILRSESIQKEFSEQLDITIEGSIVWTSECSYELTYTVAPPALIGKKIEARIIRIEENIAYCESTFEDMPGFILKFEMKKKINQ